MGNRGILHDSNKSIVRQFSHKGWVTCLLRFQQQKREIMSTASYTELFFLDEAVAFSAGHRPCFHCQPERFMEFKRVWITANSEYYSLEATSMGEVDKVLHKERITRRGGKITYRADASTVPDGTFIRLYGHFYLKWQGHLLEWSHGGYHSVIRFPENLEVDVLTPKSIVRCYAHGFLPQVHATALYGRFYA